VPGILSVLFLLGGGVLARRNLMSGRADRRGAFRVATYCFVLLVVAWVCIANHSVATALKDMMQRASTALFFAASVWIFYLAIEPFFRRYWPRRIVSWVRILDGRWRDPLVGRDVLVGFLIGLALANSRALFGLVPRWIGLPSPRPDRILDYPSTLALTDEPWVVAQLATIARDSVVTSLAIVTALVLLRVLLRNQKAAFAGFFVFCMLWYLEGSTGMLRTDLAMASIYASLTLVCVLRFGIVCFMASYFASQLVLDFPITLDFDAWYAGRSTMAMVLLAGLACLAARTALAGRPLFRDELSDPAAG
jgi:serine/threonine-protein kinase